MRKYAYDMDTERVGRDYAPLNETVPTQVAALVVVTVIRAGDVTVAVLVLVAIGAYVVSAGNNCR